MSTLSTGQSNTIEQPRFEVADVFDRYFDDYRASHGVSRQQLKVVGAIRKRRTAALGAHVRRCDHCGHLEIAYNSCRNRHCPKCQGAKQEQWVQARIQDLLLVPYHHVVFTLPDEPLHTLMLYNKGVMYDLFFQSAAETLHTFARDPEHLGAEIGFTGVLHTWGQTLCYHPHLHFIVTGGGISPNGQRWVALRYGAKFLFPVKAMSQVMRGKFIEKLRRAHKRGELRFEGDVAPLVDREAFERFLDELAGKAFVIYNKPPFGTPEQVIAYIGRYTHRVAISNYRLLDIEDGQVQFRYRDNQDGGKRKTMELRAREFIRRFLLHVLPEGFKKVRHYGILSGGMKRVKLALARRLLAARGAVKQAIAEAAERLEAWGHRCPVCEVGRMCLERLTEPARCQALRLRAARERVCFDTA